VLICRGLITSYYNGFWAEVKTVWITGHCKYIMVFCAGGWEVIRLTTAITVVRSNKKIDFIKKKNETSSSRPHCTSMCTTFVIQFMDTCRTRRAYVCERGVGALYISRWPLLCTRAHGWSNLKNTIVRVFFIKIFIVCIAIWSVLW